MSDNFVSPQYGWVVYRALHSRFIDWLIHDLDDERRAKALAHFAWRLSFPAFVLAVCRDDWARVVTRLSDDEQDGFVGVEVPVLMDQPDGSRVTDWQLAFELHHRVLGLTPSLIVNLALADVEAEVDELLAASAGE